MAGGGGDISETVLEGGTGRVQLGQRIKGYFFHQ